MGAERESRGGEWWNENIREERREGERGTLRGGTDFNFMDDINALSDFREPPFYNCWQKKSRILLLILIEFVAA